MKSEGLGDDIEKVIKKVFHVKPCKPCKKRKELLNKLFPKKG